MTKKLAKGTLVKLNDNVCFTTQQGGGRRYPLTNYANDEAGTVESRRPVTPEEETAWYEAKRQETIDARAQGKDTFSINFNDAGESRLPPRGGYVSLERGTAYRVLRARCRESFSYHNATGGWTKLLHLESGREVFYKMDKLEKVVA